MTLKNPWREHLTETEAAQVAVLDRAIDIARESDRRNTAEREKIRRRCVARGQRVGKVVKVAAICEAYKADKGGAS